MSDNLLTMAVLRRGILVVFEGIDGAGKTTQASMLEDHLRDVEISVTRTKEPTNGSFGRKLRESAFNGRMSAEDELETFIADRREHIEQVIRPALDSGQVVIIDRYYFSTAAYQGARGLDPDSILAANEAFAPTPDLLVVLKISVEVAMQRIRDRGGAANEFEQAEYLGRCAEIFDRLDRPYKRTVDGTADRDEIHRAVLRHFNKMIDVPTIADQESKVVRRSHSGD